MPGQSLMRPRGSAIYKSSWNGLEDSRFHWISQRRLLMDLKTWSSILTFLSGGVLGGLIGGATKFFWEKYLPDRVTWRRQQQVDREKFMSQVRGPAIRAMHGLERR